MTALRVAIVGAGLMGRWHAYFAARAGARIVALVDRSPAALAGLRSRYPGATPYPCLADCLDREACEIVHICTDTLSHFELALAALEAGRHVLVEKPIAGSAAETRRLLDAARSRRLRIVPVHQFPFQAGFRRIQREIDRLGDLVHVDFRACTAASPGADRSGREVLLEILPHPASLVHALGLGRSLEGAEIRITDDLLRLDDRAGDGLGLSILLSLRGRPTRNELVVVGTGGSAYVDLFHGFSLVEGGRVSRLAKIARPFVVGGALLGSASLNLARRSIRAEPAYPGLGPLIRDFYEAIRSDGPAPIDEAEIHAIAALIDRARSAPRPGPIG